MSDQEDGDKYGASGSTDSQSKPENTDKELPPLRPFRFFKRRFRLTQRKDANENKSTRYSQMPEAQLAPMFDGLDNLWRRGVRLGAEGWIALFTIVLTVATIVQSWAMLSGIEQTSEVIEQMQLEKRAWLGVFQPKINRLEAGKQVTGTVILRNTGQTPGTVQSAVTHVFQSPKDSAATVDSLINTFHTLADKMPTRENVIPPDGNMEMHITSDKKLSDGVLKAIMSGDNELYVIGRFTYVDVAGKPRLTTCCFIFNRETNEIYGHTKHNHMD